MPGSVNVEQRDKVLVATLANPPHALMDALIHEGLSALARRADEDPDVGAVVLTGAHPTRFIAHFDVRVILANAKAVPAMSPKTINKSLKAAPSTSEARWRWRAAGYPVGVAVRFTNRW
jgi:enoyl-CoA hydratase/carnithine racemase